MLRHDVPRLSPFDSFDRLQRLCNPELNPVLFWSSEYIDVWMDQWMNGLTDFCQTPTMSKRDSVRQEKWVLDYCRIINVSLNVENLDGCMLNLTKSCWCIKSN